MVSSLLSRPSSSSRHEPIRGVSLLTRQPLTHSVVSVPLSVGEKCEECGEPFRERGRAGRRFCGEKCRYRSRDRRRYETDPEGEREKSRRYYRANREKVIARVTARHAKKNHVR